METGPDAERGPAPVCSNRLRNTGEKKVPEYLDQVHQVSARTWLLILVVSATADASLSGLILWS